MATTKEEAAETAEANMREEMIEVEIEAATKVTDVTHSWEETGLVAETTMIGNEE